VGGIVDPDGRLVAVHRTWLQECDDGEVRKAPVEEAKRSLGHYRGGAVRLWRGGSRQPWDEAQENDVLGLAEGIEDALSVAQEQLAWRIAAAVSLSAMLSIVVPKRISKIVLVTQNDPAGSAAAQLLPRVRSRFRSEGKELWLLRPPGWVKDCNDCLQLKEKSRHG
jgi:hypothetical protein